jgi:hypothetical protein
MKAVLSLAVCLGILAATGCATTPGPLRNESSDRAELDHINGPGEGLHPNRELPDLRWYENRRAERLNQALPEAVIDDEP